MNDCQIGFIQGRLSPMVDGKIQSFPWRYWEEEFSIAEECGFHLMEWTLDHEGLYENPIMTSEGQKRIRQLCDRHAVSIPSLTGDCFMQMPFWKADGESRNRLQQDFLAVGNACVSVGVSMLVVPLVDNGRLSSPEQENALVEFLNIHADHFADRGLRVIFESDFEPSDLRRFIDRLRDDVFGVNYDIGNSAALGYDAEEELASYGHRIVNVHVKGRLLAGTTVSLGSGNANFDLVFSLLSVSGYAGNYILQTARSDEGKHGAILCRHRDFVVERIATS